ncbi:MAG: hypothetical protein ACRCV9_13030 [Burkholderiaceae bacterium]
MNARTAMFAIAALLAGAAAGIALDRHFSPAHAGAHPQAAHATHAMHGHAKPAARAIPQTATACRAGAYLEADRTLNSVVALHRLLPADTPKTATGELDSILYTALQQAKSEVHCVAGALTHGYDKAFADTVRKAVSVAQQRGLSQDVIKIGEDVIAALAANQPMQAASK